MVQNFLYQGAFIQYEKPIPESKSFQLRNTQKPKQDETEETGGVFHRKRKRVDKDKGTRETESNTTESHVHREECDIDGKD